MGKLDGSEWRLVDPAGTVVMTVILLTGICEIGRRGGPTNGCRGDQVQPAQAAR